MSAAEIGRIAQFTHSRCFACGGANTSGLGLVFPVNDDNKVNANCIIEEIYQGYPGVVQGGIVATILDSAMTNCLFFKGIKAMTVRLNVQYNRPVLVGEPLTVEAEMVHSRGQVYTLEARIIQANKRKAFALLSFGN